MTRPQSQTLLFSAVPQSRRLDYRFRSQPRIDPITDCRARAKSPTLRGEQSNRSKQPFRPPGGFARRCPRDGFYIAESGACRGHMRRSSTDTDRMSRSRSERSDADTVSGYETGFVITREWTVKIGYADSLAKSLASIQERFRTGYIALMFHKLPCAIRSSIRPERPLL